MTRRRVIALGAVAVLLAGGWILVSSSEVKYRVDFTSLVKIWSDVVRDTDAVGLTLTRVSDRKEMEFGTELAKQFEPFVASDLELQKYVSEVGQRLVEQVNRKGIGYEFHVISGFGINAFALPGGKIYVTTEVLKFAKSETEIAAIVAHEISHVDLRHPIERFQYELLVRRILPSDLAAISRLPYSLFTVAYSEQQEREADINAVIVMAKARYHPKYDLALADRLGLLEEQARKATAPALLTEELGAAIWEALKEYFQTHPSWPERVREIAGVLQRNESQWKNQKFYVGRVNHTERKSWTAQQIDLEFRPYDEPPALTDYISKGGYSHFKAMAVNVPSGLSSVASDEATPSAAIARAVSQCEAKIKPCRIYALGDTVVINMSAHEFDAIVSEYSKSGRIARDYKSYLLKSDFKAFAFDPISGRTGMGLGRVTLSSAIEVAMAGCSEGGRTCELYAVGDAVVQGLLKDQADASIERYRQRVVAERITKNFHAYLNDRKFYRDFRAFAVGYQAGQVAVSQAQATPSKAIERAIAACATQTMACEVYAIGDTVVQGKTKEERDVIARNYSREVVERISGARFKEYLSKRDFKVFVADVPLNYWVYNSGHWHPLASVNSALKRCRESGRDCEVVALGDKFVFDGTIGNLAAMIDEYNARIIWPTEVRNPLREYNEAKFWDFKAFAADPLTSSNWYRSWGYPSPSKAIEVAVAGCRTRTPSCELYAIGNHVVYGQPDEERKITIATYAREVLEKRLEFFRQASYANFKAIAGNPDTMEYATAYGRASAGDAVQEAMRACAEQYTPCQIFAVGKLIVFGLPQERIDKIIEQYQRDINASREISN